jgi:hypothetical protein
VAKPGVLVCSDHIHVAALQAEIVRLQNTQGDGLTQLLRRFDHARRLIENLALLADRAHPMKGGGIEAVSRSRGHNLSDGIVTLGKHVVTPGYAVSTKKDEGRLGAALAAVKVCGEQVDRIVDPKSPPRRDDRPRCGVRACDGKNVRQPVGIKLCGFCGRDMREKVHV